jgi:hypothetical protein
MYPVTKKFHFKIFPWEESARGGTEIGKDDGDKHDRSTLCMHENSLVKPIKC